MPQNATIIRATLRRYDHDAGTADVEAVAGPSALLSGVPVVRPAHNEVLTPGAEVALLLWPDVGGVVLGPYRDPTSGAAPVCRRVVRVAGTTAWVTLFRSGGAAARAGAVIEVVTAYGAPATAVGRLLALARGDATVSVVSALGDAVHGTDAIALRWDAGALQVRSTEVDVAYVAECRLLNPDPAAAWVGTWEE